MLKADLANNDSNSVVGFILYPTFFFLLSFPFPFFLFLYELCSYKVIRKGRVTLGRTVKVFMTVPPTPSLTREDITVIAAMRGPNITLLTRFMGLFIASSKTLINNVSHTNGRVVKSFLYWNFCSALPTSCCTFFFAMEINCAGARLSAKLTRANLHIGHTIAQSIDRSIVFVRCYVVQILVCTRGSARLGKSVIMFS